MTRSALLSVLVSLPLLTGCGAADWVMESPVAGGAGAGNTSVRLGAWRSQMTGLPQGEVLGVAHLDGAVFVLVKGNGIFSLRDGAEGWTAANPSLASNAEVIT